MQVSVDKESESDQELSELNDQPDVQQARDSQVETSADKLKRKYWCKNMKLPREQVFPTTYKNRSRLYHKFFFLWLSKFTVCSPTDLGQPDIYYSDRYHHPHCEWVSIFCCAKLLELFNVFWHLIFCFLQQQLHLLQWKIRVFHNSSDEEWWKQRTISTVDVFETA